MSVKGALLALYTLGVGGLLLVSGTTLGMAFGLVLLTIASAAVVTGATRRRGRAEQADLAW